MEELIRTAALAMLALIGAAKGIAGSRGFAVTFLFFGGWTYFSVLAGVIWDPAKVLSGYALVMCLARPEIWRLRSSVGLLNLYFTYVLVLTMVRSLFWPEGSEAITGVMYGRELRGAVQSVQWILGFAVSLVFWHAFNTSDLIKCFSGIIKWSASCVALYGIYVWYAQSFGLPFNPITRQGGINSQLDHVIYTGFQGEKLIRAYSVTGEPKALGMICAQGIAVVIAGIVTDSRIGKYDFPLVVVLASALYLTYSTAAYIMMPLMILALVLAWIVAGSKQGIYLNAKWMQLSLVVVGTLLFLMWNRNSAVSNLGGGILDILEYRTVARMEEDGGLFTFAEQAVIKHWRKAPFDAIVGFGLGGSNFYIRLYEAEIYRGFVVAPRGIVGLIADQGLVGLFMLVRLIYRAGIQKRSDAQVSNSPERLLLWMNAVILAVCLATISLWFQYWILIAICAHLITKRDRLD